MCYALKLKTAYDMSKEAEKKIRNITGLRVSLIVSEYNDTKTPHNLIEIVGETLKLNENYHLERTRKREIVEARHIAALLLQLNFQALTYSQMGRLFNQNHATMICAINRAKSLLHTKDLVFTSKFLTVQNAINQWIKD